MVTVGELRKSVQVPVRRYNDVAGVLVGDHVSIHLTRLFIAWGISPTVATVGMLVTGVGGSLLVLAGGWPAAVGFGLVFLYYVLDCVDGEVARYHRGEKLVWGYYEFLFHLAVKSSFFLCLGIYAVRTTGEPTFFFFALAPLLAILFQKFLLDLAPMLACRYVLLSTNESRDRFARQMTEGTPKELLARDGDLPGDQEPFVLAGVLSTIRAVATNFDLATLFFLAAALADLWIGPFVVRSLSVDLKTVLLAYYGVSLPLDFLDRLRWHVRTKRFQADCRRILRRAHHYRLPE